MLVCPILRYIITLPTPHRQCTGEGGVHQLDPGVDRGRELTARPGEQLGAGRDLSVHLQTNHGLPDGLPGQRRRAAGDRTTGTASWTDLAAM